jgi:hypothetical protein
MNNQPRPPVRHGPPRRHATGGDTLFAFGIAALGLVLVGGLLAAGGGAWLAQLLPGTGALAGPPTSNEGVSAVAPASSVPSATSTATAPSPGSTAPPVSPTPVPSPTPTATASPSPVAAGPFTMNLYRKGAFVHQAGKEWCVAAAALGMLNVIRLREEGQTPVVSAAAQRALMNRIEGLTTREDSHNGGTGPGGWAALLTAEGYPYEVRAYPSRAAALRAAAAAIRATGRPVGILAWTGIHSWVMTGFTATADPALTTRFTVETAYVLDPWYPWVSTRWPRSEAPDAPRDLADLKANFLAFNLRSGPYPGRDGRFLLVEPLGG